MAAPVLEVVRGVRPIEGGVRLRLIGELDMSTVDRFRSALEAVPSGAKVVLDLAELSFVDSSGLHAIASCARSMNGESPLVLENVAPGVRRLLEITDLAGQPGIEMRDGV